MVAEPRFDQRELQDFPASIVGLVPWKIIFSESKFNALLSTWGIGPIRSSLNRIGRAKAYRRRHNKRTRLQILNRILDRQRQELQAFEERAFEERRLFEETERSLRNRIERAQNEINHLHEYICRLRQEIHDRRRDYFHLPVNSDDDRSSASR